MAKYRVTMTVEARLPATVRNKINQVFGDDVPVFEVEKVTTPESRSARLQEAIEMISNANSNVEELRGEMEEWRDSIPDNLQNTDKYANIEEAISQLEELESYLDSAEQVEVEFPGMFG